MIRILAFITLLAPTALAPCALAADPDRVSILLGSHHVNAEYDFNEVNLGVFLTWEGEALDWSVGAYLNSYERASVAATVALPLIEGDDWQVDAFLGAALYPEDGRRFAVSAGDVVPIGGLQGRYRNAFVQVIPSDGVATDAIVSFGVTFPLD